MDSGMPMEEMSHSLTVSALSSLQAEIVIVGAE
jgi:hypothetical protein